MLTAVQGSNQENRIRIAAFGHRGVGKSTYLTALYAMLVNNTYRSVDFEYTDDDTAAKLAEYLNAVVENYASTKDWQLPPTISMPKELHFLLKRKGQEYHLNLIDYRGESTTIGEMTQNKDLLDFFATCDGLMIFNANEADEEDRTARRANHLARHQDLKYLLSSLKNRSGKPKLQTPVAMVYTKSDKIDFGTFSPKDWVEDNNLALMETLQNNVQTYRTVFLSSQMAFLNVMDNERFRLSETERSGAVVKCDTDVAYPLFWLIDEVQPSRNLPPPFSAKKTDSKRWVVPVLLLGMIFGLTAWYYLKEPQTSDALALTHSVPPPNHQIKQSKNTDNPISQSRQNIDTFYVDFIAVIDNSEEFADVRQEMNDKSPVIDRILEAEQFEVQMTNSNWWRVRSLTTSLIGYMHKSRVKKVSVNAEIESFINYSPCAFSVKLPRTFVFKDMNNDASSDYCDYGVFLTDGFKIMELHSLLNTRFNESAIDGFYKSALNQTNLNVTFKTQSSNWFVISGIDKSNQNIVYWKRVLGRDFVSDLHIEYPKSRKLQIEPYIANIATSFTSQ